MSFSPPLLCLLCSRLRLHEAKVIKDRRHHLRTYPNCFVAKELIDWLIEHKEASERDTAIKIMQKLLDQSIIHHGKTELFVCVRPCIYHLCGNSHLCAYFFFIFILAMVSLPLLISLFLSFFIS